MDSSDPWESARHGTDTGPAVNPGRNFMAAQASEWRWQLLEVPLHVAQGGGGIDHQNDLISRRA